MDVNFNCGPWRVSYNTSVVNRRQDSTTMTDISLVAYLNGSDVETTISINEMFGTWSIGVDTGYNADLGELSDEIADLLGKSRPTNSVLRSLDSKTVKDTQELDQILSAYGAPKIDEIVERAYEEHSRYDDDPMGRPEQYESRYDSPEFWRKEGNALMAELVELEARLKSQYPEIDLLDLGTKYDVVYVNNIRIKPEGRDKGVGTAVFAALKKFAADKKLPIVLSPLPGVGKKAALNRFYLRQGFAHNRGRKKDYRYSSVFGPTMIWRPPTTEALEAFTTALKPATVADIKTRFSSGVRVWRGVGNQPADPGDFGVGTYYSTQRARAINYGTLTQTVVKFSNPLVLSTDEAYEQLADRFGTISGIPGDPSPGASKASSRLAGARAATAALKAAGHDGLVVVNTTSNFPDLEIVKLP